MTRSLDESIATGAGHMKDSSEILVLSGDPALVADLSEALDESFGARVIAAESIEEARRLVSDGAFDLLLTDAGLDEATLEFVGESTVAGIPTIVFESEMCVERLLGALRAGVIDVLSNPIDFVHLQRIVGATLEARHDARSDRTRQQRLKELSSRMVRDRRMLRQRIDLLCKDLVTAYRRLAEKVAQHEASV